MRFNPIFILFAVCVFPNYLFAKDIGELQCNKLRTFTEQDAAEYQIGNKEGWYEMFAAEQLDNFEEKYPNKNINDIKDEIVNHVPNPAYADDVNLFFWIRIIALENCREGQTFQAAIEDAILHTYNLRKENKRN